MGGEESRTQQPCSKLSLFGNWGTAGIYLVRIRWSDKPVLIRILTTDAVQIPSFFCHFTRQPKTWHSTIPFSQRLLSCIKPLLLHLSLSHLLYTRNFSTLFYTPAGVGKQFDPAVWKADIRWVARPQRCKHRWVGRSCAHLLRLNFHLDIQYTVGHSY